MLHGVIWNSTNGEDTSWSQIGMSAFPVTNANGDLRWAYIKDGYGSHLRKTLARIFRLPQQFVLENHLILNVS